MKGQPWQDETVQYLKKGYQDEIDALRAELERYEIARQKDAKRLEQVKRERDELREGLKKLEYINFPYKMTAVKRCPVCGSPESDEFHSFDGDCWLAAALGKDGGA